MLDIHQRRGIMNSPSSAGPYFDASLDILKQISKTVGNCQQTVKAYIADGQAMSFWCNGFRASLELAVIFSHKILLEQNLHAFIFSNNLIDTIRVDFDYNFNSTFSLIHPTFSKRATPIHRYGKLKVHIVAPIDIVLMKLTRFSEGDREDIKELISRGLVDPGELIKLAYGAINDYVGNLELFKNTLKIILNWFSSLE